MKLTMKPMFEYTLLVVALVVIGIGDAVIKEVIIGNSVSKANLGSWTNMPYLSKYDRDTNMTPNIVIGKDVMKYATKASYCVIIVDKANKEDLNPPDYFYHVDYTCSFFKTRLGKNWMPLLKDFEHDKSNSNQVILINQMIIVRDIIKTGDIINGQAIGLLSGNSCKTGAQNIYTGKENTKTNTKYNGLYIGIHSINCKTIGKNNTGPKRGCNYKRSIRDSSVNTGYGYNALYDTTTGN